MQSVNVWSLGHINLHCTVYFCVYLLLHIIAQCWRDSSLCALQNTCKCLQGEKNVDCSCNAKNSFSVSLMLGENKNNFWLDVYLGDITSVLRIFASLFPTVKHHTTSPCRAWSKERFYCCISRILMHNLIHVACELHRELYQHCWVAQELVLEALIGFEEVGVLRRGIISPLNLSSESS